MAWRLFSKSLLTTDDKQLKPLRLFTELTANMAFERCPSIKVVSLTCNNMNVVNEKIQNSIHKAAFSFVNAQVDLETFMELLRH